MAHFDALNCPTPATPEHPAKEAGGLGWRGERRWRYLSRFGGKRVRHRAVKGDRPQAGSPAPDGAPGLGRRPAARAQAERARAAGGQTADSLLELTRSQAIFKFFRSYTLSINE
jgi:hypothetical protein